MIQSAIKQLLRILLLNERQGKMDYSVMQVFISPVCKH
ncbi:hypothetical protein ACIRA0001_0998 [Acinetobacter radioresistens SK82]|uniref:Uncharacterized protein n=1 Tax=Acinetobacter radioresistens SK82 TaxID=596318 RepID=A0ABP2GQZ1_ACIRA|nr:hypothetical protein ACIRA0001_0998 [Acinetobacter radioresistens SK82]EJO34643.1 hypothetical protein ACINWCA157_1192 [Acinetobacter radioresistens WC-A-157]EXE57772.1 hypothetical protein J579_1727 [Acinetobacter sp. 1239920]